MSDPLDSRAAALRLHALAAAGLIDAAALTRGLEKLGRRPDAEGWYRFARVHLILLGTALAVVGAIFFIAANWDVLPPAARIGLAAAVMAGATVFGGWLGLDRLTGRAAALAGGLLFGPLMALVGQIYQTGADAWELFCAWSVVMVGYSLATRFVGAWITALLLGFGTTYLWTFQRIAEDPFLPPALWISLLVSLVTTGIGLARRAAPRPDILGGLAIGLGALVAFCHGVAAIFIKGWPLEQVVALAWSIGQPLLLLAALRHDNGVVRLAGMHLLGLLAVVEGKIIFDDLRLKEGGLLLMGLLLIGQGYVVSQHLLGRGRAEGRP